ncbi:DNA/RNA polymerase [Suhomyces tanzawaensis NRRL Y-17324]|uniref:DNA polymerase n=1 Tax=Suhomyces tanzawaensis NRRL Y-17324 TaxID=984487 RepID=A0A1E4SID9_9ASCO|nr:DNA/RNA polymerase [Suhomyces tanzawaensis NRRL Y-17324]ODV79273.1 DNA/RNA polymerase [Suhomyces tanzawaensis NRRL Y-17324]
MPNDLSIQINDYDTYQAAPSKLDHLYSHVSQVPIIRIYGSISVVNPHKRRRPQNATAPSPPSSCYNVLVHVHNFYPYIYVDCHEDLPGPEHLQYLTGHIEAALAESFAKSRSRAAANDDDDDDGDDDIAPASPSIRKYIANVSVGKGTPIYGFQLGLQKFYKISLLAARHKTRLIKLVQSKAINFSGLNSPSASRNVYEGHLTHLVQFLTDFNLFGCGWLNVSTDGVYFRSPIINPALARFHTSDQVSTLVEFLQAYISHSNVLASLGKGQLESQLDSSTGMVNFDRIGKSMLELDITTKDISNRQWLVQRDPHLDFNELRHFRQKLQEGTHTPTPPQIYLSSLQHVDADLKFQCEMKQLTLDKAPSIYIPSEFQLPFGVHFLGTGSTTWSNQKELDDLLAYAIKLNTPTQMDIDTYSKKVLKKPRQKSIVSAKYPDILFRTCFELVDYESHLKHHDFVLQTGPDLVQWTDYASLFTNSSKLQIPSSFEPHPHSQPGSIDVDVAFGPIAYEVPVPAELEKSFISETFDQMGILEINYPDPFYDNEADVPAKPMVFANKKIPVPLVNESTLASLPVSAMIENYMKEHPVKEKHTKSYGKASWEYSIEPPSKEEMDEWLKEEEEYKKQKYLKFRSQIEPGITQSHFKFTYNSLKVQRKPNDFNNLSNFFLEIHSNNFSKDHLPNPACDPPTILLYHFDDANDMFTSNTLTTGILIFSNKHEAKTMSSLLQALDIPIELFQHELDMIKRLVELVELFDPDILSGYEVNASSWGYLVERVRTKYDLNLLASLGRGHWKSNGKFGDRWGYTHTSNLTVNGRHVFNVWRILRSELSLTSYTFENVCFHLLHQTIPKYSNYQLTEWFNTPIFLLNIMMLKYYLQRIDLTLKMITVRELISRNVEHSRLIGIDFNSNFYRGSQFKVESILSRITKLENILLNSPSKDQVQKMRPIECIPLVMEPDSNFYKSPMVVLDFQSLYPSIMIAYNYCYSTIVARLHNFNPKKNILGYLKHVPLPSGMIDLLMKEDGLNVSPNGYVFVKSHIRKSILAKMLEEILNTRILVKTVMKLFKEDKELNKLYNARQLALKLIANVTYGYTSATFSGRMPNLDVSDAIVATGREILTQSIELIEGGDFGAKVVYGDTDSLFVYFPGKSKDEAFRIGKNIAEYVTNQFPDPIFLKFEKVYHPCVLLSKKRYVGYKFESEDQKVASFEAKGIETVRRDGIPAQQKIVEKALRILFESKNLSNVKHYTLTQFLKIVTNKIAINDFCFAKEVRYGTYKDERYLPPGAIIAEKNVIKDARKEPQYRERVAYLVIKDSSKPRIKDRCITPEEFLESFKTSSPYNLDYDYYITRVLSPPLERIFNLIGADIKAWYREIPKFIKGTMTNKGMETKTLLDLNEFIQANSCLNCSTELPAMYDFMLCRECKSDELRLMTNFSMDRKHSQLKRFGVDQICDSCVTTNLLVAGGVVKNFCMEECSNYSCNVLYRKAAVRNEGRINEEISARVFDEMEW